MDLNELYKIERNISIHVFIAYLLGFSSEETHKVIDKCKQAKRFPTLLTHPPTQTLVRERTPRMPPSEVKQLNDLKIGQYMPGHPQVSFSNNLQPIAPVDQTDRAALAYARRAQYSNKSGAENASINPMDMTESNIAAAHNPRQQFNSEYDDV